MTPVPHKMPKAFDETDLKVLQEGAKSLSNALLAARYKAEHLSFHATAQMIDDALTTVGQDAAWQVSERYADALSAERESDA